MDIHGWSPEHERLAAELARRVRSHFQPDAPLGRTPRAADVAALRAITPGGLGIDGALDLVDDVLLPNNVALDHERFLAYIPAAPATTAALFDAVVGAWSFSGESWQEAGAAVAAENAALDWLRSLAGLPTGAGGCFVSGGSAGNLERARRRSRHLAPQPPRRRPPRRGRRAVGPLLGPHGRRAARSRRRRRAR